MEEVPNAPAGRPPGQRPVAGKHRNVCFTIFANREDFTEAEVADGAMAFGPKQLSTEDFPTWVKYVCWQLERCPDTDKVHIQGYMEMQGTQTFARIQSIPGFETAHLERRRGTGEQARAYCMKADTRVEGPWEFGEPKAPGKRNDLLDVKELIDSGSSVRRVAEDHFASFIRYGKALREYKRMRTEPRNFQPLVFLFVGPAGVGKSLIVSLLVRSGYFGSCYKLPNKHSGCWFDDYDNQDVLFVDEMDGNRMSATFFNEVNDRYECVVPAHGSAGHQLVSRVHFYCSNYLPKYWWKKRSSKQVVQTTRRIHATFLLFDRTKLVYPPYGFIEGHGHYFVAGREPISDFEYVHPLVARHFDCEPHYHRRREGHSSLCWSDRCGADPVACFSTAEVRRLGCDFH